MTEEKLLEFKEFRKYDDFIEKANKLNTSGDYYYYDKNGCGTYDINECLDMVKENDGLETIEGYFTIECHHIYGYVDVIHIPITIFLEDWDEEEKRFETESYITHDIDEWY